MEENKLTEYKIKQVLDWSYDKVMTGFPGMDSSYELADQYMYKYKSIDEAINKFIKWQQAKCATSGFLTGLGGIITLPVAIPANISSVIYIQMRMIATIAVMKGYDLKDNNVRTFVYMALTGSAVTDIMKQCGIKIGNGITKTLITKIPGKVIIEINKKVGFRLLTKFGEKGVINLGKCIPIAGGIIGGTTDALSTLAIGKAAKMLFN